MELWVYAEASHAPLGVVDVFSNLRIAWRYEEPGEMEINIPVNASLLIRPGMLIWPSGGDEAFVVETTMVEEREDGDEMSVRARTCSAFLDRRALHLARFYEGTGAAIIKDMLDEVFSDPVRRFEHFSYEIDTSLGESISYQTQAMGLLDAIVNVCRASGLGFACEFDPVSRNMVFRLRQGIDRTLGTPGIMPAVFDAALDNISQVSYTDSIADVATVVYVLGETNKDTDVRKWVLHDPAGASGYNRYEVALESGLSTTTDEKDASGNYKKLSDAQYNQLLLDYGAEQLASRVRAATTEGDLVTDSTLIVLGVDYHLGDIVLVRNTQWQISVASRIKEIEEVFDQGIRTAHLVVGDRMPTLLEKMKRL